MNLGVRRRALGSLPGTIAPSYVAQSRRRRAVRARRAELQPYISGPSPIHHSALKRIMWGMPFALVLIVMVDVLLFRSDATLAVFTQLDDFEENTGR